MSVRDDLIRFLVRYGGNCRDCADELGVCPRTGIGCGERRKAVEFVVSALEYGTEHGFASGYRILAPGALDMETLEAAAKVARKEAFNAISGAVVCHGEMTHREMESDADDIAAAIRALGGGEG